MAIHNVYAQMALENDSVAPEDVATNTFSFVWDDSQVGYNTGALMGAIALTRMQNFYLAIDQSLSVELTGVVKMKMYDRGDAEPRVPIFSGQFNIVNGGGNGLPNEVAIVLSFEGTKVSGTPQARRRGRVFLGPWDSGTLGTKVGDAAPTAGVVASIITAANGLLTANTAGLKWVVWSVVNQAAVDVVSGWVDFAFDTMRSRGRVADSRSVFP